MPRCRHSASCSRHDELGRAPGDARRVHPDDQRFLDWQAGKLLPEQANPEWSAIVRAHTARGVRFRRARVVSEPLAPFILRFEYEVTAAVSIAPGSSPWLPRRQGLDLCLPAE